MSHSDSTLRVMWPSIERRLRANGHDSVRVVVKAKGIKGCPPDLIQDVSQAVERANEAMNRDGDELVWAMGPVPTPKGPVIDIDNVGTDEQTEEWLDHLAQALEHLGHSGEITAAPEAHLPPGHQLLQEQLLAASSDRLPGLPHDRSAATVVAVSMDGR